jgi:hypothetical protein
MTPSRVIAGHTAGVAPAGTEIGRWCSWEGTLAHNTASMFRESVILVTLVAGIAARFVRSYPPRQEALTRCLAFAGFQLQVVHLMDTNSIIIVVVIVLIVLFVLGYFGRGRFRG